MDGNVQLVDPQSLNAAWMYGSTLQVPGRHVLMAATLQAQKDDEAAAMEKALEGETSDDEESAKDACEAMLDVLESVVRHYVLREWRMQQTGLVVRMLCLPNTN